MPSPLRILESFKSFLHQPALKSFPKILVVAVSGGADSVALLHAAAEVAPGVGWEVEVLHCDHGLRAASKLEARFVDGLCQQLGLTLYAYRGGLKGGVGMEERARAWRRGCYGHAAKRSGGRLVLLAHHAQDQAETVLMNLIRGAGRVGAQGMLALAPLEGAPKVMLGRPLLGVLPQELRGYLKGLGQGWKEDASNRDTKLARNRIRHRVLPELLAINPKAIENLAGFAQRNQGNKRGEHLADLLKLGAKARARAQAVLSAGQGSADLERGWSLQMGGSQVRVVKDASADSGVAPQRLIPGKALVWAEWAIQLKPERVDARKLRDAKAFWFSMDLGSLRLRVRGSKSGERLKAFGLEGSKLVRDLLAEAKVPVWQRSDWPILEADGKLVAVLGIRRGRGWEPALGTKALCLSWKTPF